MYKPSQSFIRVAVATPIVSIADTSANTSAILSLYAQAVARDVALVVFPELSITGYTIGDLVHSNVVLNSSLRALSVLADATKSQPTAMIVGLPFRINNALYNCAALLADGEVKGIVPKINLPTYREFYEKRWFQTWQQPTITTDVNGRSIPFGTDLVFDVADTLIGIEICEDVWVTNQPSIELVNKGALVICNPSASPEIATKAHYRKQLISNTSARLVCGYIYAGADPSESTTDIVMGGHALIYQGGKLLEERTPFSMDENRLLTTDIDVERLANERIHDNNFHTDFNRTLIKTHVVRLQTDLLQKADASPFTPKGTESDIAARLEEIYTIQAFGLKKRLESSRAQKVVLGLSGGLDSTLALLVAIRTAQIRNIKPQDMILTLTMPGEASSERTQSNAQKLAAAFNISNRTIPIKDLSNDQLTAIGHDLTTEDHAYENTQARVRTALLFNTANAENGIVLGTGDLSEIALGWCTYNGDHMSAYNVNSSIPKSLVRYLVRHAADTLKNPEATRLLLDIIDTPVSPELTGGKDGIVSQKTEDIVGPYELHDFFLYNFIRWMDSPDKIYYLAVQSFEGIYKPTIIRKWLGVFMQRFMANQWKRSVMTDGPKVGSVSLSPRGDWRMPSDASPALFLG
jgi:NAD+ synthase (glutamine-hydrolysing)